MGKYLDKIRQRQATPVEPGSGIHATRPTVSGLSGREATCIANSKAIEHPTPPLQHGWLVCWRDHGGQLRGGVDDRDAGTVAACEWTGPTENPWTVLLSSGDRISLAKILSVGKTDAAGRVVGAWRVRDHGPDGMGTIRG